MAKRNKKNEDDGDDKKVLDFIKKQIIKANATGVKHSTGQVSIQLETLQKVLSAISQELVDDMPGVAYEALKIMKNYKTKKMLVPDAKSDLQDCIILEE